jgi:hypothetical protein
MFTIRYLPKQLIAIMLILEARDGIEPPIKVLLTFALSLGDRAPEGTTASPAPARTAG